MKKKMIKTKNNSSGNVDFKKELKSKLNRIEHVGVVKLKAVHPKSGKGV